MSIEPPPPPPPLTEVTITAGSHTVTIKAAGELAAISAAALELHRRTHWDPRARVGFGEAP